MSIGKKKREKNTATAFLTHEGRTLPHQPTPYFACSFMKRVIDFSYLFFCLLTDVINNDNFVIVLFLLLLPLLSFQRSRAMFFFFFFLFCHRQTSRLLLLLLKRFLFSRLSVYVTMTRLRIALQFYAITLIIKSILLSSNE